MTDEHILRWAARFNYAALSIDSSCRIHYGRTRWEQALPRLTTKQRLTLIAKIEHWNTTRAKEHAS